MSREGASSETTSFVPMPKPPIGAPAPSSRATRARRARRSRTPRRPRAPPRPGSRVHAGSGRADRPNRAGFRAGGGRARRAPVRPRRHAVCPRRCRTCRQAGSTRRGTSGRRRQRPPARSGSFPRTSAPSSRRRGCRTARPRGRCSWRRSRRGTPPGGLQARLASVCPAQAEVDERPLLRHVHRPGRLAGDQRAEVDGVQDRGLDQLRLDHRPLHLPAPARPGKGRPLGHGAHVAGETERTEQVEELRREQARGVEIRQLVLRHLQLLEGSTSSSPAASRYPQPRGRLR